MTATPLTTEQQLDDARERARMSTKNFDDILSKIEELDPQKKALWREIYNNAIEDRNHARVMFETLVEVCQGRGADLSVHGQTIAKYIERMSRSNDQLVKLAELVTVEEQKQNKIDVDSVYAQVK